MIENNDVKVFDQGIEEAAEHLPAGLSLPPLKDPLYRFGAKAVIDDGDSHWIPASKDEYLSILIQVNGITREEALELYPDCSSGGCTGLCAGGRGTCAPMGVGFPPVIICGCHIYH